MTKRLIIALVLFVAVATSRADLVYVNFTRTTLAVALTDSATIACATSISSFPTLATGDWFYLVIRKVASPTVREVVRVTCLTTCTGSCASGVEMTIERGIDSTTPVAFAVGDVIEGLITKSFLDDYMVNVEENQELVILRDETLADHSSSSEETSLYSLQAAIGATKAVIDILPGLYTIANNMTINAGITLRFHKNAKLSVATTKTLTVNGAIDAGAEQIFTGAGTVSGTFSGNTRIVPQWWGAIADGSTDDRDEINSAATVAAGKTLLFPNGTYKVSSALTIGATVRSVFENGAKIKPDNSITVTINGWVDAQRYQIFDVTNSSSLIGGLAKATVVYPEWFGVTGDGSTDDTAAFQAAVTAASVANSGILSIGANSTIMIAAAGVVGKSNLRIVGDDRYTSIVKLSIAPTTEFFNFSSKSNWSIENITVDWNNKTPAGNNSSISATSCTYFEIKDCQIIKMGKFGIGLNACSQYTVSGNYIEIDTAVNTQNQGILVSEASGASTDGFILNNRLNKTAIDLSGSRTTIKGNIIYSFKFGAGITTEQASTCYTLLIEDNTIYSGTGTDVNLYNCGGIENWAARSTIRNNICYSNSGSGIDSGGHHNAIIGNICFNNGTTGGSGITMRYGDATYNGSESTVIGNVCYDTASTSGTQSYGYAEESASLNYITVADNRFKQNDLGSTSILATSSTRDFGAIEGSATYDPASLVDGAGATTTVTCTGARLGDLVISSFSLALQGIMLTAWVDSSNSVSVRFQNETTGTLDLSSGTIRVKAIKPQDSVDF